MNPKALLAAGILLWGAVAWPGAGWAARSAPASARGPHRAPSIIDNGAHMAVNNLDMVVTNHGSVAYDLTTGNPGLVYPKGSGHTVVFAAGPWIGALASDGLRVAVGEYSQEFVPGPMQNGTFLPDQPGFRNWEIARGITTSFDFLNWPVQDGAPVDAGGNPKLSGDDMIWSVYNDADSSFHFNSDGGTSPLGVEVRQSTYAVNRSGPLGNTIFLRFQLTNKGFDSLGDMYFTFWGDPDLGGFADDLVGCDTTRSLGYCYNGTNADTQYGSSPPAVGFDLLRGPVVPRSPGVYDTLGMTSFNKFINGTDPNSPVQTYNYMHGLHADGTLIHVNDDPFAPITTYQVSGDPVTGTGWLDSAPADRRLLVSSGPFAMAPGDSQEIVLAIVVGQGTDRLSSITALRAADDAVQAAFDSGEVEGLEIDAASDETIPEGQSLTFQVHASDPKGGAISLSATGLPLGASFTDLGQGTGSFQWTPNFNQAGDYAVRFTALGSDGSTADAATAIHVLDVNRAPAANAGGPYTGFVDVPLTFDGTGSSDPDGNLLSYAWLFGDGDNGVGATPTHAYAQAGLFGVALSVSDGVLTDLGTATASIVAIFTARAFTTSANGLIRLTKGKPTWCLQVEPVGRAYENALVDLSTLVMKSPGTGSVDQISAQSGKTVIGADRDGNGIEEITACFSKVDLRLLFSGLRGTSSVPVTIEGAVVTGGRFRASIDVGVAAGAAGLAAMVSPNPLNPSATLTFVTEKSGPLRATLFDVTGRLVRILMSQPSAPPGYYTVTLDGRDERGAALPSGVYFYKIESAGETSSGTATILK